MPLVGTVPIRWDNRPAITVTDFNYDFDAPTQVKAGGYGPIDTAQGVGTGTFSFKMAVRQETGPELPLESLIGQDHVINLPLGPKRYALTGVRVSKHALSVAQQQGNTDISINGSFREFKTRR